MSLGRNLLLACCLGLLALAFQGTRGLWEPDEGRYVDISLQMLHSGDYIVPHLDATHPHLAKPPLIYWMLAASFRAFGENEWAARMPNTLAFILTGLIVGWLARRLGLEWPSRAALLWATSAWPFLAANIVTTDTMLTLFETVTVAGFLLAGGPGAKTIDSRGVWLMWLAAGLAFLTKGPPGLLPLLAILVYCLRKPERRQPELLKPLPVLAFLGISSSWFLYLIALDPTLAGYFFRDEFIDRVFSSVHDRNPGWEGAVRVYAPTILVGALPWSLVAVRAWWRTRRTGTPRVASSAEREFLIFWLCVPFGVLLLAQSRLPLYLLPVCVPAALWISMVLERTLPFLPPVAWARRFTIAGLILVAFKLVAGYWPSQEDSRALAVELQSRANLALVDTIVFVDHPVPYGLSLYLPQRIEAASLDGGNCLPIARESTMYMVEAQASQRVQQLAKRCGDAMPVRLATVHGKDLLGPNSASLVWNSREVTGRAGARDDHAMGVR